MFACNACPYGQTTAGSSTTSSSSCASPGQLTTTAALTTAGTGTGSGADFGASTAGEDSSSLTQTLLIVLAMILIVIILIVLVMMCCFREQLERICPCLASKVGPSEHSQWHYVNRFGETNLKFVNYKMTDVMGGKRSDKESLVSEEDNRSVHTNISLQVPIFEEKLNGSVTKKSLHVAEHEHSNEVEDKKEKKKKRKRSKSRRRREQQENEDAMGGATVPQSLPPLHRQAAPTATYQHDDEQIERAVRRPPSAFNKPKPTREQLPHKDFVPSPQQSARSRITLDSDDDLR